MPFDGSGTFNPLSPEYPAVADTIIYADDWNAIVLDLAEGLTLCLTNDGQSLPTANIPWGNFKITGLGDGVSGNDAVNYDQVFNSPTFQTPTLVGGLASASPASGNDSLLLATTAWVQDRVIQPIYADDIVDPLEDSQLLATTAWVRNVVATPLYSAGIAMYKFQNL